MQKTLLVLTILSVITLHALSQELPPTPVCDCFDLFINALETADTKGELQEEEDFIDVFVNLKETNSKFEKCSGYYSLSFNIWTKGKFRLLSKMGCQVSEKTSDLLERGPIIYEMNTKLEEEIEKFYEDDI